jgi:hypothetical protein
LNFQCCFLFILKLPFDSEHSPVFLDHERCWIFFVSIFLSLVHHSVIWVNKVSVTFLTFFEVH